MKRTRSARAGTTSCTTYGVGKEYSKPQWQAIFRQMMGHDLVRPDPERHGALRMTETAKPILKGEADIACAAIPSARRRAGLRSRRWFRTRMRRCSRR